MVDTEFYLLRNTRLVLDGTQTIRLALDGALTSKIILDGVQIIRDTLDLVLITKNIPVGVPITSHLPTHREAIKMVDTESFLLKPTKKALDGVRIIKGTIQDGVQIISNTPDMVQIIKGTILDGIPIINHHLIHKEVIRRMVDTEFYLLRVIRAALDIVQNPLTSHHQDQHNLNQPTLLILITQALILALILVLTQALTQALTQTHILVLLATNPQVEMEEFLLLSSPIYS